MITEAKLQRMRDVLAPHVGHVVITNGFEQTVDKSSLRGDSVALNYGGFAVTCTTCGTDLSPQW